MGGKLCPAANESHNEDIVAAVSECCCNQSTPLARGSTAVLVACTHRRPVLGDKVRKLRGMAILNDIHGSKDAWFLQFGEIATVVEVDGDGDFRLRNPDRLESGFTYSRYYGYLEGHLEEGTPVELQVSVVKEDVVVEDAGRSRQLHKGEVLVEDDSGNVVFRSKALKDIATVKSLKKLLVTGQVVSEGCKLELSYSGQSLANNRRLADLSSSVVSVEKTLKLKELDTWRINKGDTKDERERQEVCIGEQEALISLNDDVVDTVPEVVIPIRHDNFHHEEIVPEVALPDRERPADEARESPLFPHHDNVCGTMSSLITQPLLSFAEDATLSGNGQLDYGGDPLQSSLLASGLLELVAAAADGQDVATRLGPENADLLGITKAAETATPANPRSDSVWTTPALVDGPEVAERGRGPIHVEVLLRSGAESLGLQISTDDKPHYLAIDDVLKGGLVHTWNAKHAARLQVQPGDIITSVNGVHSSGKMMLEAIREARAGMVVHLRVETVTPQTSIALRAC